MVFVLVAALIGCGGWFAYKNLRPKKVDPRLKDTTATVVPPEGEKPFDPKPLMDKVAERITTDNFRFAVLGDSKHAATLPAFIKYLDETVKPDFVLTTGDMVAKGGGQPGPGYYQMLSKELGADMRSRPWWPAIGNHEVAGNPVIAGSKTEGQQLQNNQQTGIENFKRFYNLSDDHYSFAFRNCCFIVLPFRQPQGAQLEWLESELKKGADAKQHLFIVNHLLFFTVGSKNSDDVPNKETPVTALFKKYGVTAVFSGHDHGYYRTVRNGIPYFVSAGGGATIYAGKRIKEALPEDVYYNAVESTYDNGKATQYVLHKGTSAPEQITTTPDQFLCVVDVHGDVINCFTVTVKGEKWDEIQLSK